MINALCSDITGIYCLKKIADVPGWFIRLVDVTMEAVRNIIP